MKHDKKSLCCGGGGLARRVHNLEARRHSLFGRAAPNFKKASEDKNFPAAARFGGAIGFASVEGCYKVAAGKPAGSTWSGR